MLKKVKFILGEQDYNRLKKPFFLSFVDSFFGGFAYAVMFITLIQLTNNTFSIDSLFLFTLILLTTAVIRFVLTKRTTRMMQTAAAEIMANLRIKIGDYIRNINMGFFNKNSIGVITNTLTNDLNDLESGITNIGTEMLKNVISMLYIAIFILIFNPFAGGIQVAILLLEIPLAIKCASVLNKVGIKLRRAKSGIISRIIEYTSGIEVFKAFNLTGKKFHRLKLVLQDVKRQSIRIELSGVPYIIPITLLAAISFPIALFVSVEMYTTGTLTAEQLITFTVLSLGLANIVKTIASQFIEFKTMTLSIDRIDTLLHTPQIDYEYEGFKLPQYDVVFQEVDFSYDQKRPVLHNLSFKAQEGKTTALVGSSGSGKSTVLNLITRFWDVTSGTITIGGTDIRKIYPDDLLTDISIVFQDVYLLNDTVFENIRMGMDASPEQVMEAARLAHCHEFVSNLKDGYDTVITEGGKSLSGGEKQRISLARAIIKNAPIVLLDEATASLDADNEHEIQKSIRRFTKDKTVLVIAHRLNTIKDADNILVLDEGRIIEQGSHEELLALSGTYASMYTSMAQSKNWIL